MNFFSFFHRHKLLIYYCYSLPQISHFSAIRLTGPFVTMIYSMITGDMFTFSIIYIIVLFGFSQAYFFLYKGHENVEETPYYSYFSTWMGLFQTTLGDYDVSIKIDKSVQFQIKLVDSNWFHQLPDMLWSCLCWKCLLLEIYLHLIYFTFKQVT